MRYDNYQLKIISLIDNALKVKEEKEAQATILLASIDDYLLSELGIKLPQAQADTVQSRMFYTKFGKFAGERLDPLYHSIELFEFLEQLACDVVPIKQVAYYLVTGFAAGKSDQSRKREVIQIRPTNINDDRELVFRKNIYIKRNELSTKPGDILKKGEVLFNNTNSQELVGKTAFFNVDGEFFCSNHITRIKVDESKILPQYLTAILNLYQRQQIFYRICTNWNNQSGVNTTLLESVKIPLPSMDKQLEIVEHIQTIRKRAMRLRREAKDTLAKAKTQVEQMILGKEAQS